MRGRRKLGERDTATQPQVGISESRHRMLILKDSTEAPGSSFNERIAYATPVCSAFGTAKIIQLRSNVPSTQPSFSIRTSAVIGTIR